MACRDIKPDNLLIHESGALRIADFGCSIQFDTATNPNGLVSNTAGTIAFWPPEAISSPDSSNAMELRAAGSTHDIDNLPPILSPMSNDSKLDTSLEESPHMIESYDEHDLDSLPPMTMANSHDLNELPDMDLNSLPPLNSGSPLKNNTFSSPSSQSISMTSESPPKYSSYSADIWAAGITIHCFLYGSLPFSIEKSHPADIMDKIRRYQPPNDQLKAISQDKIYGDRPPEALNVWSSLMTNKPEARLSLAQAFEHIWLKSESERRQKLQ